MPVELTVDNHTERYKPSKGPYIFDVAPGSHTIYRHTVKEHQELTDAYNNRQDNLVLFHMATANSAGVHSYMTSQDYNTAVEYYTSPEYIMARIADFTQYSQSLHTARQNTQTSVFSHSRNVRSLYVLAEYHEDAGNRMDYLNILNFTPLITDKETYTQQLLASKDAAVLSAYLLGQEKDSVPVSLFKGNPDMPAAGFQQTIRQAQIMTCLAHRLEGD